MMVSGENGQTQTQQLTGTQWLTWAATCALPIFFVFMFMGDLARGVAAAGCTMMIVLAMRRFWDSRNRYWFWVTITGVIFLHAALVLLVRWPNLAYYTGIQLLPLGYLDLALNYYIIKLAKKLFEEPSSPRRQ
jgi:hypothetical protein